MLETPFLGKKLNLIIPGTVILFSILFVVLSAIGYENKAVRAFRGK
jgi:hypothetical protein